MRDRKRARAAILACALLAAALAGAALGRPRAGNDGAADPAGSAGLGSVRFPTSGGAAAQALFLRGVAALHSFWYDEAAEAFRAAEKAEPGFAMAYWGEAMTENHPIWAEQDRDAARAALAKLAATPEGRAAKAPTPREKGYLAAVETLYGEGDKPPRDDAYAEAMGKLAAAYPEDDEAAAFHALAVLGTIRQGQAAPERMRRQMQAAAILEELFGRHPDHPGVAHYLIHAYDDPIHAPLGLRAARVYARIAPAAPHALHMPSHIFVQLGRWEDAVASNEAAWAASVAWVARKGLAVDKRDFHSLSWLQYAYLQEGRYAKAAETVETARQAARESAGPRVHGALAGMEARQVLETRHWAKVPLPEKPKEGGYGHGGGALLAAGLAAAHGGDLATAGEAAARLGEAAKEGGYEAKSFQVMEKEVSGLTLLARRQTAAGLALLGEAVAIEESMDPPSGPPDPQKPAHELYGEALLELDRPRDAAEQFAQSLARTPRRAASLLGAARAAARLGEREAARERYATLAEIWRQADPGLPENAEARTYLAGAPAR